MSSEKIIFFDTETTGVNPKTARIVQLFYQVTTLDGKYLWDQNNIIQPYDFDIPIESSKIHGITDEIAWEKGIKGKYALNLFLEDVKQCNYIVAHNFAYDSKVVANEVIRYGLNRTGANLKQICTMLASTKFCGIKNHPNTNRLKWPKLEELYEKLFSEKFENAHDAKFDVEATIKCFFELKKRGIINL